MRMGGWDRVRRGELVDTVLMGESDDGGGRVRESEMGSGKS